MRVMQTIIIGMLMILAGNVTAQEPSDFQISIIDRKVSDFPDKYDLSTPLNSYITIMYVMKNGKAGMWQAISSESVKGYQSKSDAPDVNVSDKNKEWYQNTLIKEVIVYKDSIAGVLADASSYYSIRFLYFENGKWVNKGENAKKTLDDARRYFMEHAQENLNILHKIEEVNVIPSDTMAFVSYAKKYGKQPKTYMLDALAKHKLVIYGEVHRRKVSWDLMRSLLNDPRFAETVGTVFVELPSYQQSEFDRFYASPEMDTEILLDIMRSEQIYGWWDRGEYEFLIDVWKLNQKLPEKKKIKVVATDAQLPYKSIKTPEEFQQLWENMPNRNENMANVIEQTIQSKTDKRNSLFIVGYAHAYKSDVLGAYSSSPGNAEQLTAGAQLVRRLPKGDVFITFQHIPVSDNRGRLFGEIRHGVFDTVFAALGNQPIAFDLHNSPFGAEPFDASGENRYKENIGSFEDNFDGYIFLQPLKDEDADYVLYDIWTDEFVKEMKRRAALMEQTVEDLLGVKDASTQDIINEFKNTYEGKKRWSKLFE